ncbi:hypothetical protein BHE74_00059047 [Ensete ventricosum]|nr:hypothetical protein BHE74_00059047 [Ensete ventricosum]
MQQSRCVHTVVIEGSRDGHDSRDPGRVLCKQQQRAGDRAQAKVASQRRACGQRLRRSRRRASDIAQATAAVVTE